MKNYLDFGKCGAGRWKRYLYLDTEDFLLGSLLERDPVKMKFETCLMKDNEQYRLVMMKVLKRDEEKFLKALAELPGRHFNFGWNRQLDWIDTSAQMAFDALNLSLIAEKLGKTALAAELNAEHQTLKDSINELLWDERKGFYFDRLGDKLLSRRHIGAFWVLIAEVAPPERAERLVRELTNPDTFGLPYGVPSLAKNDPDYDLQNGYWRGPVWCPTMYMLLCGLRKYGYEKLAHNLAERFYRATLHVWETTGTIWENYLPELNDREPGKVSSPDFCGWSALAPVTICQEFLN